MLTNLTLGVSKSDQSLLQDAADEVQFDVVSWDGKQVQKVADR